MMRVKNFRFYLWLLSFTLTSRVLALPIGFGRNQGDLEFQEIVSKDFAVYYDKRTPQEGRVISNALEAAKPTLENWFKVKRSQQLPVIVSSTTSNASFANFITDALELQTMGRGGRDLAWHELTHNIMYRHLDNFFGPVGNIIHLPWLPAWWLEGLAEATSNSIGSDGIYSIERHTALTNTWPKYDKLHSLYTGSYSYTGYAISGAFVSYILRTYGADAFPNLMSDFFDYTLPWWWPWSLVPFNDFMPMDAALVKFTGKTGQQLFEEYKQAAKTAWEANPQGLQLSSLKEKSDEEIKIKTPKQKAGSAARVGSPRALQARGDQLYDVTYYPSSDKIFETRIDFYPNFKSKRVPVKRLPNDTLISRVSYGDLDVYLRQQIDDNRESINYFYLLQSSKLRKRFQRLGSIERLFKGKQHLYWLEANREETKLCYLALKDLRGNSNITPSQISCPITQRFPHLLHYIGEKFDSSSSDSIAEIWLSQSTETLYGDSYKILRFSTQTNKTNIVPNQLGGRPIAAIFHNREKFLLLAGHTSQFLRKIDPQGSCLAEYPISSHLIQGLGSPKYLYLVAKEGLYRSTYRTHIDALGSRKCQPSDEPRSPLIYAMIHPGASFQEAMLQNDPWSKAQAPKIESMRRKKDTSPPLHLYPETTPTPSDAQWRGRPVFAFPWIGADSKGYSLGTISIPLMDHLQNETITLSALYGIASQFPTTHLDFLTTRFKNTYGLSLFRRQLWNGNPMGSVYYFDQRGVEFKVSRYFHGPRLKLSASLTASDRLPYGGEDAIWALLAHGYSTEATLSLSQSFSFHTSSLSYFLSSIVAPEELNDNFKYDKLGLGLDYGLPVSILGMASRQSLGLFYGRTRGKARPFLREVYRPLKTFVPGTGGGLNEINVGLLGPGYLTSPKYGDTQARFKWAWTFPLVRHLETLIHIFYLERLDFTAFFNYGSAWDQHEDPDPSDFIKAHGYNLDLQSDIKGVTVNLGLGAGQVFQQDWEVYVLFGFDALIDP